MLPVPPSLRWGSTRPRELGIPLHQALDRIATREGFEAWSLLAAKARSDQPVATLLAQLRLGDLVLLDRMYFLNAGRLQLTH